MFRRNPTTAACLALLLPLLGCGSHQAPDGLDAGRPPAGATAVGLRLVELPALRRFPARVEAIDPVQLSARVLAPIASCPFESGATVHAGQVLIELDRQDAEARLAQAEAGKQAAQAEFDRAALAAERARQLSADGAATQAELEAQAAAEQAARAALTVADERVREARTVLGWHTLSAPFDAVVQRRLAHPGDLAAPGQVLLELCDPSRLRALAEIPAELAGDLAGLPAASLFPAGSPYGAALSAPAVYEARPLRVRPNVSASSGTRTVEFELPAGLDPWPSPGALFELRLDLPPRSVLLVPKAAVKRFGQLELVLREVGGRAVQTPIRTVLGPGDELEVLAGLSPADRVYLP